MPTIVIDYRGLVAYTKKKGVRRVTLFGSRARGDARERSDIDLAVTGGDAVRFSLDADEETSTLLSFDVVNPDRPVQPELLESIRREEKVIYEELRAEIRASWTEDSTESG